MKGKVHNADTIQQIRLHQQGGKSRSSVKFLIPTHINQCISMTFPVVPAD